jgi:hypothetical protein
MINQYNGFKSERTASSAPLPVGGYVLKIMKAVVEQTRSGSEMLVLNFDVAEGDNAGFFVNSWKNDTRDNKKWRGAYRLFLPAGDGSERDNYAIRNFNNFVFCLEDSNPGYHWNWDEAGLTNLKIGGIWRNKEYSINGKNGWTTEMGAVATVEEIKENKFKPLKDKALSGNTTSAENTGTADFTTALEEESEEELPF